MKFRTILADPPWQYEQFSEAKHGAASSQYSTLTIDNLCALPVAEITQDDAVLLMWCTWPKMEEGLKLIGAWGFEYKTGFPWIKMAAHGAPRVGIGWHTQSASEFVLIGTRGVPGVPPQGMRQVGIIFSPIGRHSAKPDAQYSFAEAYGGPFLEMFHRPDGGLFEPRPGWTFIGNEVTGRDIGDDLRLLIADTEAQQPVVLAPEPQPEDAAQLSLV